jgi:hypothetical protein
MELETKALETISRINAIVVLKNMEYYTTAQE